jgi:hypothetical protein
LTLSVESGKRTRVPCTDEIDIDTSKVNSPQQPSDKLRSRQVPRSAVALMIIIVASLALVAGFANIQRFRRGQIETIVVVPTSSATPQPR